MQIKYPNYDNSILSIAASVLKHYGAECSHSSLPLLDKLLAKNYKNVVVMVFDGMGTAILTKHLPKGDFFHQHMKAEISSVFPPTTTAATISMQTGLSPIEHGWLGWSLYFPELDSNVDIFPNTLSKSGGIPAANYHVASRYMPSKKVVDKIREATNDRVKAFEVSPFSSFQSKSLEEICNKVKTICREDGQKYIYTYWHQPDFDMHEYGVTNEIITGHIRKINDEVEAMCSELSDTLVIITADHGLVDTKWRFIPDYPELERCLKRMPSIEARAASFFVKRGYKEQFVNAFHAIFGDEFILFSKKEILDKKLFGNGKPHPRAKQFIGDYLAVAVSNISIEYRLSTAQKLNKAVHAGLTADEMNVPLIIFHTRSS